MQFGNHAAIMFFWVVLVLFVFYIWAFKVRSKLIEKFVQKNLLAVISDNFSLKKSWLKAGILLMAAIFLVLALIRPQWGYKMEEVKRKGVDIFIALDVSKSMLAEDIKPNRLERSKLAISDMVKNLQGDRIGLIAFAGSAFIQCPLTNDYNGFMLSLNDVDTGAIPKGGTAISLAIKEALNGFENSAKKYRVLILISDGEDHEGTAETLAKEAAKQAAKIYCIGIGNPDGELITVTDYSGAKSYLKDREGKIVKSRLNEQLLQKIALTTGGSYIRATATEFGLNMLYKERISKMEKRDLETKINKRFFERYQIPLAVALMLLLIEPLISERKEQWM